MVFRYLFLLPLTLFAEIGYVEPWGQDSDITLQQEHTAPTKSPTLLENIADTIINFHHSVTTHISGPRSHFRPSSSYYMQEAIIHYGFLRGFPMGCDRLLRENSDRWVYKPTIDQDRLYKWDPPLKK